MPDDTPHPDVVKIRALAHQLHEHFDSVQIIATRDNAEESCKVVWGTGNIFARVGATRAWLTGMEAYLAEADESDELEDDDA